MKKAVIITICAVLAAAVVCAAAFASGQGMRSYAASDLTDEKARAVSGEFVSFVESNYGSGEKGGTIEKGVLVSYMDGDKVYAGAKDLNSSLEENGYSDYLYSFDGRALLRVRDNEGAVSFISAGGRSDGLSYALSLAERVAPSAAVRAVNYDHFNNYFVSVETRKGNYVVMLEPSGGVDPTYEQVTKLSQLPTFDEFMAIYSENIIALNEFRQSEHARAEADPAYEEALGIDTTVTLHAKVN